MAPLTALPFLLLAAYLVYREASRLLYNTLLKKTALAYLPLLGQPRKFKLPGNAVVCGGRQVNFFLSLTTHRLNCPRSLAGLFAARVLADHYQHVLIVEPEEWVTTEEGLQHDHSKKRTRVPQYAYMHGYQVFLGLALQSMFGDAFEEELRRAGGR